VPSVRDAGSRISLDIRPTYRDDLTA